MKDTKPTIRAWLYTSEFVNDVACEKVIQNKQRFMVKNRQNNLSGFLITNGVSVMQLLEGPQDKMALLKSKIEADDRHKAVESIIWDMEQHRAYPKWSMKYHDADDYEALFEEIESARIETIATQTARLLFDLTFDE